MLRSVLHNKYSVSKYGIHKASVLVRQLNGLVVGVPKESLEGEARVGLTPTHVGKLIKQGAKIQVQAGAVSIFSFLIILFCSYIIYPRGG